MTLLRNGLKDEGENSQGGWMEKILPRRGRTPAGQDLHAEAPIDRHQSQFDTGLEPTGSAREAPQAGEIPRGVPTGPGGGSDGSPRPRGTSSSAHVGGPGGRTSIAWVVATLLFGAIAAVALLEGSNVWADVLMLMTITLLGVSVLGCRLRLGSAKASWLGFAVFGWGYLAMACIPWSPQRTGLELPTSPLLNILHGKLAGPAEAPRAQAPIKPDGTGVVPPEPSSTVGSPGDGPRQAASSFLLRGSPAQFLGVGHCLITLLAALLGSGVARWFHASDLARG